MKSFETGLSFLGDKEQYSGKVFIYTQRENVWMFSGMVNQRIVEIDDSIKEIDIRYKPGQEYAQVYDHKIIHLASGLGIPKGLPFSGGTYSNIKILHMFYTCYRLRHT